MFVICFIISILISFIITYFLMYLYVKFPFIFCPFTHCRYMPCRQGSSESILGSKNLTTSTDSTSCEYSTILTRWKWLRKMYRHKKGVCLSYQYCNFCPVCKGNKIVCCGTTQLPVSSLSLKIFALCSPFMLQLTWHVVILWYTLCVGHLDSWTEGWPPEEQVLLTCICTANKWVLPFLS